MPTFKFMKGGREVAEVGNTPNSTDNSSKEHPRLS